MLSFPFGLRKTPVLVKIICTIMFAELRHCEGVFFPESLGAVFFYRCCGGIEGIEGQRELVLARTSCLLGCQVPQAGPVLTDGFSALSWLTQAIIPTSCPLLATSRNKWAGPSITGGWTSSQSEGSTPCCSQPEGSTPCCSQPGGSTPCCSQPEESTPCCSQPKGSTPCCSQVHFSLQHSAPSVMLLHLLLAHLTSRRQTP